MRRIDIIFAVIGFVALLAPGIVGEPASSRRAPSNGLISATITQSGFAIGCRSSVSTPWVHPLSRRPRRRRRQSNTYTLSRLAARQLPAPFSIPAARDRCRSALRLAVLRRQDQPRMPRPRSRSHRERRSSASTRASPPGPKCPVRSRRVDHLSRQCVRRLTLRPRWSNNATHFRGDNYGARRDVLLTSFPEANYFVEFDPTLQPFPNQARTRSSRMAALAMGNLDADRDLELESDERINRPSCSAHRSAGWWTAPSDGRLCGNLCGGVLGGGWLFRENLTGTSLNGSYDITNLPVGVRDKVEFDPSCGGFQSTDFATGLVQRRRVAWCKDAGEPPFAQEDRLAHQRLAVARRRRSHPFRCRARPSLWNDVVGLLGDHAGERWNRPA